MVSAEGEVQLDLAGAKAEVPRSWNVPNHFQMSHVTIVQDAKNADGNVAAAITTTVTTTAISTVLSLASSDSGMSAHSNSSEGSSSSYDDRSLSPATLTDSPLALIDETSSVQPPPLSKQQLQLQQQSAHGAATNVKQSPMNPVNGCCINGMGVNGVLSNGIDGTMNVVVDKNTDTDKGSDKDNVSDSDGTKTTREDRRNNGSSSGNGSYSNGTSSMNSVGGNCMPMEATNMDDSRSRSNQ